MAIFRGPNISVNGLILYLDYANNRCYVSGDTSYDLSKNGHVGTLIDTPIHTPGIEGNLLFNGTTQFVNLGPFSDYITNGLVTTTIEMWMKTTSTLVNGIYYGGQNTSAQRLYIGASGGFFGFGFGNTAYNDFGIGTKIPIETNTIYHTALVINEGAATLFIDGVESISKTDISVSLSGNFTLGCYYVNEIIASNSDPINIYNFKVYNRALELPEVINNYNALKGRYKK